MTLVPAACAIAYAVYGSSSHCGEPIHLQTWLYVCAALQLINLAVVIRTFAKFDMPYNPADPKDKDYIARMHHLMCYDATIAIYLLIVVFQVAWQIVGHIVRNSTDSTECPEQTQKMGTAALALMWLYLGLGCLALMCGYMTEVMETRCCPYFAGTGCGSLLGCLCPGMFEVFRRNDAPQSVTSTGGNSGMPLSPVVPVYHAPGAPHPGIVPQVYSPGTGVGLPKAGASYAANAYAVPVAVAHGYGVSGGGGGGAAPHQRNSGIPYANVVPFNAATAGAPVARPVMGQPKV